MSKVREVTAKAKAAMLEVKSNFRADEGTTGFPKIKSMFVNLWKSGKSGREALIVGAVAFALVAMCLVCTVSGKDRIQEIFELAEKSAARDGNVNFCGFFVGMSRHDHAALREYYHLGAKDWGCSYVGTVAGEKAIWRLFFSLNAVRNMVKGGDTIDELAKAASKHIGDLKRMVDFNTGEHWFERKTVEGTVVVLNDKGLVVKNEKAENKDPLETSAAKADRMAMVKKFESLIGPLLPGLINDMVAIPGKGCKMGKYEVTQAQWEALMEGNPSNFKNPDNPVDSVSWRDCREFMNRLNLLPAVKEAGLVFRLPSDTEWRDACRADSNGSYAEYCNLADGTQITKDTIGEVAWYSDNSGDKTHPVGQKKPNAYGLYDMLGNVSEWTGSPDDPPVTPIDRGGCYGIGKSDCKSSFGYGHGTDYKHKSIGFRLFATTKND